MPKLPKGRVQPPKPRVAGRISVRQQEVLEALEALKAGKGRVIEDDHGNRYCYIGLDQERVETIEQARSALYNLRWKLNPRNPKTGGDPSQFQRYFGGGRGAIRIEEQNGMLLMFVPYDFVEQRVVAKKPKKEAVVES
jgi:hypothetical protein